MWALRKTDPDLKVLRPRLTGLNLLKLTLGSLFLRYMISVAALNCFMFNDAKATCLQLNLRKTHKHTSNFLTELSS